MNQIKVLQVGLSSNPGGIETCIRNYFLAIDKKKIHFDLADIYGGGLAFSEDFLSYGCKIYSFKNCNNEPMQFFVSFRSFLLRQKYDIIHINALSLANILPIIASLNISNSRVIVHSHNSALPKGVLRYVLNSINAFLIRRDKRIVKWACGINAGRWMWGNAFDIQNVIPNAIDVNALFVDSSMNNLIKNSICIPSESKIVGFIGHLVEQKNVLFLPEIAKVLKTMKNDVYMIIIGDGPLRQSLVEKCIELDVLDRVRIVGIQDNIPYWYRIMDTFILPSLFEGVPVVGVEAQAVGLNVVFSDRISQEIALTKNVCFLPIDQGATLWAHEIIKMINKGREYQANFPQQYNTRYAGAFLLERYLGLFDLHKNASDQG